MKALKIKTLMYVPRNYILIADLLWLLLNGLLIHPSDYMYAIKSCFGDWVFFTSATVSLPNHSPILLTTLLNLLFKEDHLIVKKLLISSIEEVEISDLLNVNFCQAEQCLPLITDFLLQVHFLDVKGVITTYVTCFYNMQYRTT